MKTQTLENKIREICTYHSDDGTSGYCLSNEQFRQVFDLLQQAGEVAVIEERDKKIVGFGRSKNGSTVARYED